MLESGLKSGFPASFLKDFPSISPVAAGFLLGYGCMEAAGTSCVHTILYILIILDTKKGEPISRLSSSFVILLFNIHTYTLNPQIDPYTRL